MTMATISIKAESTDTPTTEVHIGKHKILIDEPALFGGNDLAPSPVEFLLASIAGCISAIGHWQASQMGIRIEHLVTHISGQINSDAFFGKSYEKRCGFQKIEIQIKADAFWSEEEKAVWLDAVMKRCPVIDNISNQTIVEFLPDLKGM